MGTSKKSKNKKNIEEPASNIIKFPIKNKRLPDLDQFKEQIKKAFEDKTFHKGYAEEATELFCTIFLEHLALAGYDLSDPKTYKDLAMLVESLKAYLFKYYGVYHPIQAVSERTFVKYPNGKCFLNIDFVNR